MDKSETLRKVLEAMEEEGEDLPFADLLRILAEAGEIPVEHAEELSSKYGDLPPRVAVAKLSRDPKWKDALRESVERGV